jgi:hypothetical protein
VSVDKRLVLAVLAVVAVFGVYWTQLIAPKRAESARVEDRIAQAQSRRDAAVRAAGTADAARRAHARDVATVTRLGKAVPADDDVASLVFQLESVARRSRIDFRAVKLAGDGAAPQAAAAGAEKPSDAGGSGKQDAATAPSSAPSAPAVSQAPPGAVVGTAGLLTLPFSFTFDGGYLPMQRMLGAIDRLADATDGVVSVRGRLVTIDGFSLTPSRLGLPKVKAQVSATAYISPPADAAGAASPGSAAAAATPGSAAGAGAAATTTAIQGVGR